MGGGGLLQREKRVSFLLNLLQWISENDVVHI